MYTINQAKTAVTLNERIAEVVALEQTLETEPRHHSDGSELIPAAVQTKMRANEGQLPNAPQTAGYTVDGEGLVNAYATEPKLYFATYPSPEQQRRYMFQGALAVLLVAGTLVTALSVS